MPESITTLYLLWWVTAGLATLATPETPFQTAAHKGAHATTVAAHGQPIASARRSPRGYPRPDSEECLACHDDEGLTMDRDGKEVSLYVSTDRYGISVHGSVDCLDCHEGFDPEELPHADPIKPVECAACHGRAVSRFESGPHAGAMGCKTCHDNVHVVTQTSLGVAACARCHSDPTREVAESAHGSSEAGPSCFDCHSPHRAERVNSASCTVCHSQKAFVQQNMPAENSEFILQYSDSIHGKAIECADCHTGHRVLLATDERSTVHRRNIPGTCARCHEAVSATYEASEHGAGVAAGNENAPTCTDCHGEHNIRTITDSESPVSRMHEIQICESCHLDSESVRSQMTHSSAFVGSYERSIHGRAVEAGNLEAAICSDCHGAHESMKASNPESRVNQLRLASTCGRCHQEVEAIFDRSIHGVALQQGNADAPTCATCHGEHEIIEHTSEESPVAAQNVSERVCGPCHSNVRLSAKYGFPSDRTASFSDSFHGLAGRLGSREVANCVSCHGVHDILPADDPESMIHPANLEATCGNCHPGANANFSRGTIHIIRTPQGDRLLYWISTIYLIFIILTVGAMAGHNVLDWVRKIRAKYQERYFGISEEPESPLAAPPDARRKTGLYLRMTIGERVQHLLMLVSFFALVITGFTLKFPDAFWVQTMRGLVGELVFGWRGSIHRIAAVVMVADTVYHVYYMLLTARGRRFVRDIWFGLQDFRDMVVMLRYNLGLSSERPRFDRFNYIEKAEYWALVWGTAVMTITGFVLWFENQFMAWFSKLFVDVAETVHYWEAWLAFLAILVWHIYYVILNPDVYPMNFAWITGKLTRKEMEHEHPLELERLEAKGSDTPPKA